MRPCTFSGSSVGSGGGILAGCGYAGEPKPPALERPDKVDESGGGGTWVEDHRHVILPQETTEGLPITEPPDIEMRIGGRRPWNQDTWQTNSGSNSRAGLATCSAGCVGPRIVRLDEERCESCLGRECGATTKSRQGCRGAVTAETKHGFRARLRSTRRSTRISQRDRRARAWAEGSDDGWSFVTLAVLPVLPVPRNVHPVDAPGAVHLEWVADAPAFRIFRRLSTDTEWAQIGESTSPSFDDKTFSYGKVWQYYVQSVRKVGDTGWRAKFPIRYTFTPVDRFAPAVPAGLGGIAGARTIELSWELVMDADLAGYRVYRNGVKIAEGVQANAFSDPNVVAGTKYSYQVSAVDTAGNESGKSVAAEITME